jgi:hypothetical protein
VAPSPSTNTPDEKFYAGIRRQLTALGSRVGAADCVALAEMAELRRLFDEQMTEAVRQLRNDPDYPATWDDIGEALGMTKSAARKHYAHVGGLRQRGAQPVGWR